MSEYQVFCLDFDPHLSDLQSFDLNLDQGLSELLRKIQDP